MPDDKRRYAVVCPFCERVFGADSEESALAEWSFHMFASHPDMAKKAQKVASASHEPKKTIREHAGRWMMSYGKKGKS